MDPVGFHIPEVNLAVVVDWRAGRWTWLEREPDVPHYRVAASHFLRVCQTDWGWSTLHIGCRFTVRNWRGSDAIAMFMPVSSLYALRYFHQSWRHYLKPRVLGALWARRLELTDIAVRTLRGAAWSDAPVSRL